MSVRKACSLLLALLVALIWENTLSSPDPPARALNKGYQYPDIFQLRREYADQFETHRRTIASGDTFYSILKDYGIPFEYSLQWQQDCSGFDQLSRLQPGDDLELQVLKGSGQPFKLVYHRNAGPTLVLLYRDQHWECHQQPAAAIELEQTATGTIEDNLYDSCARAGVPAEVILELADLFAFDIDFNTDIQDGDSFALRFRQTVADGQRLESGPILAAEMTVAGTTYQAFHYALADGYQDYFDANGHSLRKMFLKAPLSYRRISSTFSTRRFHPVLKIYRPHLGIDYAAAAGTPVSALGDGKVEFAGRKGGFGNYLVLTHGSAYKTTYGHLLRFAKGIRAGAQVRQGQVIGYVGATGLATGPHLDFRFYRNGKPINFLTTAFPHARSMPNSLRADFEAQKQHHPALFSATRLAQAKPHSSID